MKKELRISFAHLLREAYTRHAACGMCASYACALFHGAFVSIVDIGTSMKKELGISFAHLLREAYAYHMLVSFFVECLGR